MDTKCRTLGAHPSEDTLEDYSFNRLAEVDTSAVEEHLLVCESCRNTLTTIDEYIFGMKAAIAKYEATRPAARRLFVAPKLSLSKHWTGTIVACSAALAAVCLTMLLSSRTAPAHRDTPVALAAFRGAEGAAMAHAPSGQAVELTISLSEVPEAKSYRLEVVTAAGVRAWQGEAAISGVTLSARLEKGLKTGVYWIRLYSGSGELLREFGLRVG